MSEETKKQFIGLTIASLLMGYLLSIIIFNARDVEVNFWMFYLVMSVIIGGFMFGMIKLKEKREKKK